MESLKVTLTEVVVSFFSRHEGHDPQVPGLAPPHGALPDSPGPEWEHQSGLPGGGDGETTGAHCCFQPTW